MKFGRMMHNHNISIHFEDDINRCGRSDTSPIGNVKMAISYKVIGQMSHNFAKYFVNCVLSFSRHCLNLRKIAMIECIPQSAPLNESDRKFNSLTL